MIFRDLSFLQLQSNPENTVGILTMAGKGVRVLTTPTSDLGKILACMHGMYLSLQSFYLLLAVYLEQLEKICSFSLSLSLTSICYLRHLFRP